MCQFMCSWYSVRVSFYCAVLCLLVAGYLEIMLKTEQIASNEYRLSKKHAFLRLSTNFGKSIPTTAYQTFLFEPYSISRSASDEYTGIIEKNRTLKHRSFNCTSFEMGAVFGGTFLFAHSGEGRKGRC